MKYCIATTKNHPVSIKFPSCIVDINDLIFNEGYLGSLPLFTNNEVVLNLDIVEGFLAKVNL